MSGVASLLSPDGQEVLTCLNEVSLSISADHIVVKSAMTGAALSLSLEGQEMLTCMNEVALLTSTDHSVVKLQ